jgi:predicted transposase/invertase (TIGR01784 family)
MQLIGAKSEEEYNMLAEKKPIFKKVVAVVKKFSADEEARLEFDIHEKWRRDYASSMNYATRKGLAEGMEKKQRETAQKMKAKGYAVADIADITGLTKEEIKNLQTQVNGAQ